MPNAIDRANGVIKVKVTGTAAIPCGWWYKGRANPRGYKTCALSNRAIVKGDMVYHFGTDYTHKERVLADVMERHWPKD